MPHGWMQPTMRCFCALLGQYMVVPSAWPAAVRGCSTVHCSLCTRCWSLDGT